MGVPSMARPRQTATTATPARAPRKPAGRSKGNQPASGRRRQKARNGREAASKATTAKPNPFDDIARQVNADQEAKDRAAGRDDLTPASAKSVDQAKAKPSGTSRAATKLATPIRPAKPTRPTKVQANRNGVTFSGRPTTKVETVAARVKSRTQDQGRCRRRCHRCPATGNACRRVGMAGHPQRCADQAPGEGRTKQPAKAKPKQMKPDKAPTITLDHLWGDKKPDWLYRCTLVTRYQVRPDGTVWSTLDQVLGPDGKVVEDFWRLPLDFRPTQEVQGNGRKLVLKDRTIVGLQPWLIREGLTTPEDITT